MSFRRLWIAFASVVILSFAVLGWTGIRIYQQAPPVPERVITADGTELIGPGVIHAGQNVWQSMGGMEIGSVLGHGSYVAPDWSADSLHREALFILNAWAAPAQFTSLSPERQAELESRLQQLFRRNTYSAGSGTVTVDAVRAEAFAANLAYYTDVFMNGREEFAIPAGALTDPNQLRQFASFFFWTSWAASTIRPGDNVTYTSNWPYEPLVGNRPTPDTIVWTGVSIILLGIGLMLFSLRALDPVAEWKEGLVKFGFWATNIGLMAMVVISLLPVGLMQTWASVEHRYWYARSPEFLQTRVIETFRWLRVIGDTVFAAGAIALAAFVIGLRTGGSTRNERFQVPAVEPLSTR